MHWLGGVAVVMIIVLPRARRIPDPIEAIASFKSFERPFTIQVRISILLAGASGAYMIWRLNAWASIAVSTGFLMDSHHDCRMADVRVMVYVLEPFLIHSVFHDFALRYKDRAFTLAMRLHMAGLCA
jgi:uncharacterized membrane protein